MILPKAFQSLLLLIFGGQALSVLIVPFEHSLPCMTQPINTVQVGDRLYFE